MSDQYPGDEALWLSGPDGIFIQKELPPPDPRPWYAAWTGALLDDAIAEIQGLPYRGDPTFADGARAQSLLASMLRSMHSGKLEPVLTPPSHP